MTINFKLFSFVAFLVMLLGACAPKLTIENTVVPQLFSAKVTENTIKLQGRYWGDGANGAAEASYVLIGADVNGDGGVAVRAKSWSTTRIEAVIPKDAGFGFVFVVVNGAKSNGLPLNTQ
ncbi:MAG: hypothetical protein ACRCYY_09650 [Trueperaceae bacterium]